MNSKPAIEIKDEIAQGSAVEWKRSCEEVEDKQMMFKIFLPDKSSIINILTVRKPMNSHNKFETEF